MQGICHGRLFKINCHITQPSSLPSDVVFSVQYGQSFDLWHWRLAHINEDALRYLVKHNLVTGMDLQMSGSLGPCDSCVKGKHPQAPFPKQASRATKILGWLHMDLQGHFKNSTQGFRYTLAVADDCSQMGWKRYLKAKSEASDEIQALIAELKTSTGLKVKVIRFDGGGEFADGKL